MGAPIVMSPPTIHLPCEEAVLGYKKSHSKATKGQIHTLEDTYTHTT